MSESEPTGATDLIVFDVKAEGKTTFDDIGVENGTTTWKETDLARALGYAEGGGFRKAVIRAMQGCLSLNIPTEENFISTDGGSYKLTRFACYLIAMNADTKKPQVAAAQVYFARIAETFRSALEHADGIERVAVRDEMSGGIKSLGGVAKAHGVKDYALFQNAGYRGMYNMNLSQLNQFKGLPKGERLLDRMGREELAGNFFRVTQTEARIKSKNVQGQAHLESAAEGVGREVRRMMIENTGNPPETLAIAVPIKDVKRTIKATNKKFKELDGKGKRSG